MSQTYTKIGTVRRSPYDRKIELRIVILDMAKKSKRGTALYLSLDIDSTRFVISTKSVNDDNQKNLPLPADSIIATYDLPMDFFKDLYSDCYPQSDTDLESGERYYTFKDVLEVMANNTINLALDFIDDPSIKIVGCDQNDYTFKKFIEDCCMRILVKLEIRYAKSKFD